MPNILSIHIGLNRVDPTHYQDEHGNPSVRATGLSARG